MKETLYKSFFAEIPKIGPKYLSENKRIASIALISLLGAWIVCLPYEGQLLYSLAKDYGIESNGLLDVSLVMQVVGLILGGIILRTTAAAKKVLLISIPVCVLCTVSFFFPSFTVWVIMLTVCSILAGIGITATGYFFRNCIGYANRFRVAAELIINITVLKVIINNISMYISIQMGFAFTILMLAIAWYLTMRMNGNQNAVSGARQFDKRAVTKALILLFMFIAVIAIDYGIMIGDINPKYTDSSQMFTSWYWALPYIGAAFIMKHLKNTEDRGNILYVAVGFIGFGFILFLLFDYSITSYLIINTVMMGAWAVYDVFWWSTLGEMLEMVKNPARILSVGFSAIMIGVFTGKLIAENHPIVSAGGISIVPMAVIFITLIILPVLHRVLSMMIKKNAITDMNTINLPSGADNLTEREIQIAALLLKGRTYKLIASELYLSENTVKTHIKNIYSKLGVKSKSDLLIYMMK